jgi:hypothetical protein
MKKERKKKMKIVVLTMVKKVAAIVMIVERYDCYMLMQWKLYFGYGQF